MSVFFPSARATLRHDWVLLLHTALGPVSPMPPQQSPLSFRALSPLGWAKQPKTPEAQQHP